MSKRINYIDYMRGIAIILVVMGHLIQFNGFPTSNPVFEFIYSFHMPLFFAISGYITQRVTSIETIYEYFTYLKKKFLSIILPLITWSLFIILAYYGIFNLICNKLKSTNFLRYFFAILPTILLTLASVYLNITKTNLLLFTYAFYLGCFTAKFPIIERLSNKQSVYAISLLSFFTFSTHWNFAGNHIDDIYKIAVSTFAFITLLNLCQKFNFNTKVKKHYNCLEPNR